jgi:hypothetical protein
MYQILENGEYQSSKSRFRPFPSPSVEVDFSTLSIGAKSKAETQVQYGLYHISIQILASSPQHRPWTWDWTPGNVPPDESTVRVAQEKISTLRAGLTLGTSPDFTIGGTTGRVTTREEVVNRSTITARSTAQGTGKRLMQWAYAMDSCQNGWEFSKQQRPGVKFGFKMPEKPHLEIDLLAYWTEAPTHHSGFFQLFSPSKGRKPCPVFRNFLQQTSLHIPLDKLEGICWVPGPHVEKETKQMSEVAEGQCDAMDKMQAMSKNQPVDLEVTFGCALHGKLKPGASMPSPPTYIWVVTCAFCRYANSTTSATFF